MGWLSEDDIAFYDLRYTEEQRFNPDQPRDDRGRWGDGSATVQEHLSKGHAVGANNPHSAEYVKNNAAALHNELHNAGTADHGHPDRVVNVVQAKGLMGLVKAVNSLGPYNTPSAKGDAAREHVSNANAAHMKGDLAGAKSAATTAREHAAAIGGRQGNRLRDTLDKYLTTGSGADLFIAVLQAKAKNLGE